MIFMVMINQTTDNCYSIIYQSYKQTVIILFGTRIISFVHTLYDVLLSMELYIKQAILCCTSCYFNYYNYEMLILTYFLIFSITNIVYSYIFRYYLLLCHAPNIILYTCQCCISIDDMYGNDQPDNRQCYINIILLSFIWWSFKKFCVVLTMKLPLGGARQVANRWRERWQQMADHRFIHSVLRINPLILIILLFLCFIDTLL